MGTNVKYRGYGNFSPGLSPGCATEYIQHSVVVGKSHFSLCLIHCALLPLCFLTFKKNEILAVPSEPRPETGG